METQGLGMGLRRRLLTHWHGGRPVHPVPGFQPGAAERDGGRKPCDPSSARPGPIEPTRNAPDIPASLGREDGGWRIPARQPSQIGQVCATRALDSACRHSGASPKTPVSLVFEVPLVAGLVGMDLPAQGQRGLFDDAAGGLGVGGS